MRFLILGFFIVVFLAIRVGIGKKQSVRDYIRSRLFNHKRHEQLADMSALLATDKGREMLENYGPLHYQSTADRRQQLADMLALLATEENREMNDKTITMDEALSFVIGHYTRERQNTGEFAAARRLIEAGITRTELDRMNLPGDAALQDRIDGILYGTRGNA